MSEELGAIAAGQVPPELNATMYCGVARRS